MKLPRGLHNLISDLFELFLHILLIVGMSCLAIGLSLWQAIGLWQPLLVFSGAAMLALLVYCIFFVPPIKRRE